MRVLLVALLLAPLAGCLADGESDGDKATGYTVPPVPEMDGNLTVEELEAFAPMFPDRKANSPDHVASREYLADKWESYGFEVWRHAYENEIPQENIIGIQWGVLKDQWVVVGAHYDTTHDDCIASESVGNEECPGRQVSQGAYDDGSGVAFLIELAEYYQHHKPYYTIVWAQLDGEERGTHGSAAFVEDVIAGETPYGAPHLRGFLDVDMIGLNWPGADGPLEVTWNSLELLNETKRVVTEMGWPEEQLRFNGPEFMGVPLRPLGSSDFRNFDAQGVPFVFYSSSFYAFQAPGDAPATVPYGAYPFWHMADTMDNLFLMAGSRADLAAGFETSVQLSAELLHFMAYQPDVTYTKVA